MKAVENVVGYIRVSTDEQAESGAGLAAQKEVIQAECGIRGWPDPEFAVDEGHSAATLDRPGLNEVIGRISRGEVDVLVVAKLDRLSRSVVDFSSFLTWIGEDTGCKLLVLDLAIDTSTPGGELVGNVIAAVAQWERRVIGARTKEGLAAIRSRGEPISRPAVADHPELRERIRAMRGDGMTLQRIADAFNQEKVPTLRGGSEWRPSSVHTASGYRRRASSSSRSPFPRPGRRG